MLEITTYPVKATDPLLTAARRRYLEAARECWQAWKAYLAAGGSHETLAYFRFRLPAPEGHAKTGDGMLFDHEAD